jgi:hypothetical protein
VNAEIERCTTRIAQEEVAQLLRGRRIAHQINALVKQEMVDRLRQAIDLAVQDEIEAIEREIPD